MNKLLTSSQFWFLDFLGMFSFWNLFLLWIGCCWHWFLWKERKNISNVIFFLPRGEIFCPWLDEPEGWWVFFQLGLVRLRFVLQLPQVSPECFCCFLKTKKKAKLWEQIRGNHLHPWQSVCLSAWFYPGIFAFFAIRVYFGITLTEIFAHIRALCGSYFCCCI